MMSQVKVQCPNCQTRLVLTHPGGGVVQITCSKCAQLIRVNAPAESSPAPATSAFDSLPSAPPSPIAPPGPPATRHVRRPQARRKRIHWKPWLVGAGSVVALALVSAGAYVGYQAIPEGSVARLNPLMDSHESVVDSVIAMSNELLSELEAIKTTESRTSAISKLEVMTKELDGLKKRAAKLGPISDVHKNELTQQFESERDSMKERLGEAAKRLTDAGLASESFKNAMKSYGSAFKNTTTAIDIAWLQLPEPQSEHARIDMELIELRREYWRSLVSVSNEDDYRELHHSVTGSAERVGELTEEKKAAYEKEAKPKSTTSLSTKAGNLAFDLVFQIADQSEILAKKYGINEELSNALSAWNKAESVLKQMSPNLDTHESMLADSQRTSPRTNRVFEERKRQFFAERENRGDAMNDRGSPRFPPGSPPAAAAAQRSARMGVGSSSPVAQGSGSFQTGAAPGMENARYEQNVQNFLARNGPSNVVIIRTTNASQLKPGVSVRELIGKLNIKPFFATKQGENAVMVIRYSGPLEDVTKLIEWGEVTSVDSEIRLIRVTCRE